MKSYMENLRLHCVNDWAINSHSMVRKFRSFVGGDTRAVCEKHYAQFMPRDAVDEDIGK